VIGGPLLLIVAPIAAAVAAFLVRRRVAASALVAVLVAVGIAAVALLAPSSETQEILGRPIALGDGDRIGIAVLAVVLATLCIGAWQSSPGWSYYPIALVIFGALAAALIIRPPLNEIYPSFIYSALFMAIAVALSVFMVQGGQSGATRGALRLMALMTLSLPVLLLADWTLAQLTQSPDSPNLAQAAIFLVGLGFTFLLAIFPFHTWIPTVSRESPPFSATFVLTVVLGAVVILLLDVLNENRLVLNDPRTLELLRGAALLMTGLGAALAWAQADFGTLMGYGAIADMGSLLFAVSMASRTGLAVALIALIVRSISLVLMAAGLTLARERALGTSFAALNGLVWRLPWASLAIVAGGLSLAGLPPLAGFAARWGLLHEAGRGDPGVTTLLLAASVSIALGVLRGLRQMLHPPSETMATVPPERRGEIAVIAFFVILCLLVGLFPGALAPLVRQFSDAYRFAGP
jgi:formate hydrogenlyase subunit 3/multisubunit Na+/H+ antiporter MnhD subunit